MRTEETVERARCNTCGSKDVTAFLTPRAARALEAYDALIAVAKAAVDDNTSAADMERLANAALYKAGVTV